ncbi:hypothetical protein SRABI134_04133 [Peribacillus sp. Bi134]|nr:hypothetical protein SRABI134_04133 [Peribacillus sp. Bi134]
MFNLLFLVAILDNIHHRAFHFYLGQKLETLPHGFFFFRNITTIEALKCRYVIGNPPIHIKCL